MRDGDDLRALYDAHDWFKLREAITGKEAAPLFRGAVAAAFGRVEEAEQALHPLINGPDSSRDADEADDWLSYMFVRTGQYQKAAAEMDEGTPLLATLRHLPDQSVSQSTVSSVPCRMLRQRLFVPLTIQQSAVEFFVDSDANFSFVSESEAKSLGMTIEDSALRVHGAGGIETSFRMAVANEVAIGGVQLRNVAFMVMPDSEEAFAGLDRNQQGAIGLPVLLALGKLRYTAGRMEVGLPPSPTEPARQNLCFDGLDPVVQIGFDQRQLPAVFDTGAAATEFWPPFAEHFPEIVNSTGKTGSATESSFGGKSRVPQKLLPELVLRLGGCDVHIRPARVLLAQTTANSRRYYARIGLDALKTGHETTIDFRALQLTVH